MAFTELLVVAAAVLAGPASAIRSPHPPTGNVKARVEECNIPEGFRVASHVTELGTLNVVVREDFKTDIIARHLTNRGFWEIHHPRELAQLANTTLPVNGTFVDVGANVGWYTLLFAKIGYQVVAVEPMRNNRKAIEAMLCMNPDIKDRVRLMPVAVVGPDDGNLKCVLYDVRINKGNGILTCLAPGEHMPCRVGESGTNKNGTICEVVKSSTLDQVLEETGFRTIDVVKMDIEGFECKALQGGQSLFKKYRVKLFQAETKHGETAECFAKEAQSHGYRIGQGVGWDDNRVMSSLVRLPGLGAAVDDRTMDFSSRPVG